MNEPQNEPIEAPQAEPRPRASRTVRKANAGPQLRPLLTGVGVVVVLVAVIVLAGRTDRTGRQAAPPDVKPGRIQVETMGTPATPAQDLAGATPAEGAAPPAVHFYEVLSGGREAPPAGGQIALRPMPMPPPPDGSPEARRPAAPTPVPAAAPPVARPAPAPRAEAPAPRADTPVRRAEVPKPIEAAKAPAPSAAPAQAPAADGPRPYALQVGSFSQRDSADELAGRLKTKGFDSYLVEVDLGGKGVWWRVRVGRFPTEYAAKWARLELVKEGLSPIVIRDRATP